MFITRLYFAFLRSGPAKRHVSIRKPTTVSLHISLQGAPSPICAGSSFLGGIITALRRVNIHDNRGVKILLSELFSGLFGKSGCGCGLGRCGCNTCCSVGPWNACGGGFPVGCGCNDGCGFNNCCGCNHACGFNSCGCESCCGCNNCCCGFRWCNCDACNPLGGYGDGPCGGYVSFRDRFFCGC